MQKTNEPNLDVFDEVVSKIKTEFAVLSKDSIDRLIVLAGLMATDSFNRGFQLRERMTPPLNVESFKNALDQVMQEASAAGISTEDIESTMTEYAHYAKMYTAK
jgi:hypothetical protein